MNKFYLFLAFLATAISITAQESSVSTDRPGASSSPTYIHPWTVQIETGGSYTSSENGQFIDRQYSYNNTLVRLGLLDGFEFHANIDYSQFESTYNGPSLIGSPVPEAPGNGKFDGFSPLSLGAKIKVADGKGWLPDIALLGHIYLPFTASSERKPETTGMDFIFLMSNSLSDTSSLTYNLGASISGGSPELSYLYTLSYGCSLSSSIGFFVELYGNFPEDTTASHNWDAGFTYLATNDLQFDLSMGTGISGNQKVFGGAGLSYRFK